MPPGGGPPGGGVPGLGPGGGPGGGLGELSPEARATAIAERMASNGDTPGAFLERGMLFALIRTLQVKTGEIDAEQATPPPPPSQ